MSEKLKIQWAKEEEIKVVITNEMKSASQINNGVRVYPYIEVDGVRYYLENLED